MNMLRRAVALIAVSVAACGGDETGPSATTVWVIGLPGSVVAGQPFTLVAELRTAQGDVVTTASGRVTLALESDDGVAFSGPSTVVVSRGIATFSDLTITRRAGGLRFVATSGELTGSSTFFAVSAAAASPSASRMSPATGNVPPTNSTLLTVNVRDAYGNAVGGAAVTMSSTMPGGTFFPASGTSSAAGAFSTVFVPGGTGPVSITAAVNGAPIPTGAPFAAVDLCVPFAMSFPGSIEGAQPCGNYVATAFAPTPYTFSSAGGAARISVESGFTPVVALTSDVGSNDILFLVNQASPAVEWLLPPGDFKFHVGTSDFPGRFTVTGITVAAEYHQDIRVLASTGTYTGQALSSPDYHFAFGIRADRYLFRAPGSCTITMVSDVFDVNLRVYDPISGALLANVQGPVGIPAVIQRPNCRGNGTNPMLIIATSVGSAAGAYTLTVDQPLALRAATPSPQAERAAPFPVRALKNPPALRR